MAIEILNQAQIRPGFEVSVEVAKFQQKGHYYRPRERKQLDKLQAAILKAERQREEAWSDEDVQRDLGLKIVIIEGFYTHDEINSDEQMVEEIRADLIQEIESQIGECLKVELYPSNPQGICKLKFQTSKQAEQCIELMDERWFDQRQLKCYYWDGTTDYKQVKESVEILQQRVEEFGYWLETTKETQ